MSGISSVGLNGDEIPTMKSHDDGDYSERESLDEWKYGKAFTETYIEPDPVDWRFRMM